MSFEETQVGATAELSRDKKKKVVQVYKQKHLQRGKKDNKNSVIIGRCFRNILQPIKTNCKSGEVIVWQLSDNIYPLVWCKFLSFQPFKCTT